VLKLAQKEPDIVLIAPDGGSTYLKRATRFGQVHFFDTQGQPPGNVNAAHLTARLADRTLLSVTRLEVSLRIHRPPERCPPRRSAHWSVTSHSERMDPAAASRGAPAHAP
jgi:hypothetical protein